MTVNTPPYLVFVNIDAFYLVGNPWGRHYGITS